MKVTKIIGDFLMILNQQKKKIMNLKIETCLKKKDSEIG